MPKRGLPSGVGLKRDSHYVEELTKSSRAIGRTIPVDKIEPNPRQPRIEMGDLEELANSIRQKGVLEPILVTLNREKGTWVIVAGERRWRAAVMAGLSEMPCVELDLDESEIAEVALVENLQRKDLTVWEEVDGLAALAKQFGYTHDEIARKIGKSRSSVTEALTIAGLPEKVRRRCVEMNITAKSVLLEVARQFDEKSMLCFLDSIALSGVTSRERVRKLSADEKGLVRGSNRKRKKVFQFSYGCFSVDVFCTGSLVFSDDVEVFLKVFCDEFRRKAIGPTD